MTKDLKLISCSAEETVSFGYEFAKNLKANDTVGLFGSLGSGKTQFVKGICRYFKVEDLVNSPTFIIVNEYEGIDPNSGSKLCVNHFDLYRLKSIEEFKEIGIDSYVNDGSICLIEWAELADVYFGGNIEKIFFEHGESENQRIITNYKLQITN